MFSTEWETHKVIVNPEGKIVFDKIVETTKGKIKITEK